MGMVKEEVDTRASKPNNSTDLLLGLNSEHIPNVFCSEDPCSK